MSDTFVFTDYMQGWIQTLMDYEKSRYDSYDQEVKEWFEPGGEGHDHGYTFPACIHGKSRWTEYDNICGPCEDGYGFWDEDRARRDAEDQVRYALQEVERRVKWIESNNLLEKFHPTRNPGDEAAHEVHSALVKWYAAPGSKLSDEIKRARAGLDQWAERKAAIEAGN